MAKGARGFNKRRFWQNEVLTESERRGKRTCKTSGSIEAKDCEVLTGKEEVQRRWREHFCELLQSENEGPCKSEAGG